MEKEKYSPCTPLNAINCFIILFVLITTASILHSAPDCTFYVESFILSFIIRAQSILCVAASFCIQHWASNGVLELCLHGRIPVLENTKLNGGLPVRSKFNGDLQYLWSATSHEIKSQDRGRYFFLLLKFILKAFGNKIFVFLFVNGRS